ncbi:glycosyltransferase [Infirmifilum sp.]|uniref:glycosyltransferase n=1 Tax=Infirmifilum sp. TaxID=2856575 RepID=UPI003D131E16
MLNELVLKYMGQAKVFVYPTRKDLYPLVIGEALSRGTPAVTYYLPGIRLAYGDCGAVIRVRIGDVDAMAGEALKILEDPQPAERLRRAALEWCARKRWSDVARRELRAYCSLR